MASGRVSTNNFGTADFIVDNSGISNGATHSTITAAIADAVSGQDIFIRTGSYTENFTLPAGINLIGHLGDSLIPQVTIVGKITMTAAGTSSISNIRLQTNSDFFLVVSGAAASVIDLNNCYLNCTNNTGISLTSSSASASVTCVDCSGDLSTTGITYSVSSSPGSVAYIRCFLGNTGLSVTPITGSEGSLAFFYSIVNSPTSCTGTCLLNFYYTYVSTSPISAIPATFDSTVQPQGALFSVFHGITNTAVSIGAGSVIEFHGNNVQSTNAIAIDGSGTIFYDAIHFGSSSSNLATTLTQTVRRIGPNVETGSSQSGQTNNLRVSNTSNTANSGALLAATVGGSSAGDPFSTFTVSGSTAWSQGIDNSVTGDPWVLSASAFLGTSNVMSATTAGVVSFPTSISVGGIPLTFSQGTFSPTVVGSAVAGTVNMTTQVGRYQKVGRVVHIEVVADWSTLGGATGNPLLNNLPFTVANVANLNPPTAVSSHTNPLTTAAGAVPFLQCLLNTTTANIIYYLGSTGAGNNATITASNGFTNQFSYETT